MAAQSHSLVGPEDDQMVHHGCSLFKPFGQCGKTLGRDSGHAEERRVAADPSKGGMAALPVRVTGVVQNRDKMETLKFIIFLPGHHSVSTSQFKSRFIVPIRNF